MPGTHSDNTLDMIQKGRGTQGEKSKHAKLTSLQVIAIREEFSTGKTNQPELARKYGVAQPTISDIIRGVTWKVVQKCA
jgi:DNA-binding transcriptional regulator YiaG